MGLEREGDRERERESDWIICFCSVPIEAGQVLLTAESVGDRYVLFYSQNNATLCMWGK